VKEVFKMNESPKNLSAVRSAVGSATKSTTESAVETAVETALGSTMDAALKTAMNEIAMPLIRTYALEYFVKWSRGYLRCPSREYCRRLGVAYKILQKIEAGLKERIAAIDKTGVPRDASKGLNNSS
jgi:hypothetical protein